MREALAQVPGLAAQHLLLSAAALAVALTIGLPLALAARTRPRLRGVVLAAAGLVQTIPGLALLALFYPLLLALSALLPVPALGFLPALLALALYALLPILRNASAALAGIDPAIIEAADGLGMTAAQKLRLVEAPLAAPVAMAGIRTAAVWTIGTATLATTVGAASLGNLIFAGLQTETWTLVLAGCLGAAGLALAADGLLALIERGLATRRRAPLILGLGGVALALVAAAAPLAGGPARPTVTVGAKNFAEQYILARVVGRRLERAGFEVAYREGLGSGVAWTALTRGDIDVYVDYSGTLWTNQMSRRDVLAAAPATALIAQWARARGVVVLGPLGFENAYALAMRRADARRRGITSLADLAARAPRLRLGADLEFLGRPEWVAIRDAYGLRFADARAYSPTFMYRALASGQADVITAFSSDGRIATDDLLVLADPARAVPRYDALLLLGRRAAGNTRLVAALRPLVGAIKPDRMRAANAMVDRATDKRDPAEAARWLDP